MDDKASKLLLVVGLLTLCSFLTLYDSGSTPYSNSAFFEKTVQQKFVKHESNSTNNTNTSSEPQNNPNTPEEPEEPEPPIVQKPRELDLTKDKEIARLGSSVFLSNGGTVPRKDMQRELLCKLGAHAACNTKYIAEVIDLVGAITPIYAEDQKRQELLYTSHSNFIGYLDSIGIPSVTLEAIYPNQTYMATKAGNEPRHIQIKVNDTFYYRENFLNVAIRKTTGLEYYIWIDAHQIFLNTYWWEEAIWKMEHFNNVQFFQTLAWLRKDNNATDKNQDLHGVQYAYTTTRDLNRYVMKFDRMWNGNAVGIRREIYEGLGDILDICIAGCCDCSFNVAGMSDHWDRVDKFLFYGMQLRPWIQEASKVFKGEVAVVRGRMLHFHHDHFFAWERYLNALAHGTYVLKDELYRDENYTLHVKYNSPLLRVFKQI